MTTSPFKPAVAAIAVFGILLASLSQSVCVGAVRQKQFNKIVKQQLSQTPRDSSYIRSSDGRRRQVQEIEIKCRLWQNCILFEGERGDSHQWVCSFDDPLLFEEPGHIQKFGGYEDKVIKGAEGENIMEFLEINGASSGTSVLVLSTAEILNDSVVIQLNDVVRLEEYDNFQKHGAQDPAEDPNWGIESKPMKRPSRRGLAQTTGTLNTLVVRVTAQDNAPASAMALSEDIFGDEYCLKSQYARCSYNQLLVQEYIPGQGISNVETLAPGVVEVFVDTNAQGNDKTKIQNLANIELKAMFGGSDPGSLFDAVLFCMPPGMGSWIAYAYINRADSYYNNDWCQALSSQMHEVGHSLGLHHSGEYTGSESNQEYGDQTDLMGYSQKDDDLPVMCFNPAKSWQLGWYTNKQSDIDPSTDLSTEITSFMLNGVVDYEDETQDRLVVLKIGKFYIGFNKATDFNNGVKEAPDQVTIIEKLGSATDSSKSKLAAKLSIGDTFTIVITELLTVNVKYASNDNGKDAIIEVNLDADPVVCEGEYDAEIIVDLLTDNYPTESSWGIVNSAGQYVFYRDGFTNGATTYSDPVRDLCRGIVYYFVMGDTMGDGICCNWGIGNFTGTYDGEVLFLGGEFTGNVISIPFTLPMDVISNIVTTDPPTPSPTNAPTLRPTSSVAIGDDPDFLYRGKPGKDCNWVAKGSARNTKIKCLMGARYKGDELDVWRYCKTTCCSVGYKKACI